MVHVVGGGVSCKCCIQRGRWRGGHLPYLGGGGSSAAPMLLIGFEPASRFQSGARGASSFVWSSSLATEPVSACSGTQQAACSPPDLKAPSPTRRRLPSERAVVRRTAAMRSAPLPCRLYALVPLLSVRTSAQLAVSPSREFVPHRGMRISPEITRHNVE